MINDEDVESLKHLGLTEREAKVYLSLVFSGPSSIKTISKISTVARQDTYRIITSLYSKGLVEQIISVPATFEAVSIKKSLDSLLQNKIVEVENAIATKNLLLKKLEIKNETVAFEYPQFMLVSGKGNILRNAKEKHENAKESICCAGPWEAFITYFLSLEESLEIAKKNQVKIRILINKPENVAVLSKIDSFLKSFPNIKLKYTSSVPFLVSVHDKKICTYSLFHSKFDISKVNLLRSTNPSFIELIQNYFDNLWKKTV